MEIGEIVLNTSTNLAHNPDQLPAVPDEMNIGRDMQAFMSELKKNGRDIAKLLDEVSLDSNVNKLLNEYINEFSSQTCRVAVIGQMKAGKSAFINALIGRADLLPSDVNPWTTVVTRLHFGDIDLPSESAEFNFFDEHDWQRIAEGGGKLRELVERFLPGFEEGRLARQLAEMRTRAEQRLGSEFHQLLGRSHWYDNVTSDVIRKYVCAGEIWNEDMGASEIGRFSDITEAADVYLKPFPFAYPTALIDTPGTNDPFFVRDEITCQNLDSADIFIVVLHAQQALSMTDLGLLRILQGLHKDRIIIFINRIDQLNDWRQDSEDIRSHVQYMLSNEFPSVDFPIIVGSAIWGQHTWKKGNGHDQSTPPMTEEDRANMFRCSGIPEVAMTLSNLMLKGKGRSSVAKIISNLNLAVEAVLAVLKNKMKRNETIRSTPAGASGSANNEVQNVNSHIAYLGDMSSKASYCNILYEKQLETLKETILDHFRTKLNDIIIQFADSESLNMVRAVQQGQRDKIWRCDTMTIRRALEDEFLTICKQAAKQINAAQATAAGELKKILAEVAPNVNTDFLNLKDVLEGEPYLSTLALNHTISLDLDNSWWKQWWTKKRKEEEWANELVTLIKNDFFPMVERLVQSAKSELNENTKDSINNYAAVNSAVVSILQQRMDELQERADMLNSQAGEQPAPAIAVTQDEESTRQQVALQQSQEYLTRAENISQRLMRLQGYYQAMVGRE